MFAFQNAHLPHRLPTFARSLGLVALATLACSSLPTDAQTIAQAPTTNTNTTEPATAASVDLVLLLDTSGSMDGLIEQTKQQLWTIVNDFGRSQKDGQTPLLRVALYEYGNDGLPHESGWIRQVSPFTDNLDDVSAKLFELTTNGGSEHCGQAIDNALQQLDWSAAQGNYQVMFIAGNEPFTQGPIAYADACTKARDRGIVVNTIHCGNAKSGIQGHWQDGATIAEGLSFNIDQNQTVAVIETPMDAQIVALGNALNNTYLWYGQEAKFNADNQTAQDNNAQQYNTQIAMSRATTKSMAVYRNVNRDLVDTYVEKTTILQTIETDQLPENMRAMTMEAREAHIQKMLAERQRIQAEIRALNAEREAFIRQARAEQANAAEDNLGQAITQAVRQQLANHGFTIQTPGSPGPRN